MYHFAELDIARKVFLHINNSNPAWLKASDERKALEHAGWQIAHTQVRRQTDTAHQQVAVGGRLRGERALAPISQVQLQGVLES